LAADEGGAIIAEVHSVIRLEDTNQRRVLGLSLNRNSLKFCNVRVVVVVERKMEAPGSENLLDVRGFALKLFYLAVFP
jgi:hypothetical protein